MFASWNQNYQESRSNNSCKRLFHDIETNAYRGNLRKSFCVKQHWINEIYSQSVARR